ncbi:MAG: S46 family peptidase [Bacteroidetes bacterium]|nr:S46 family peptidase [Bacteroidota bacterium]
MKKFIISVVLFFTLGLSTYASGVPDEGLWLPMFVERLNYVDMEKLGLQLTAEEIYSINNSSLKDAIVGLSGGGVRGFFCTGGIVSDQGLMFTNHHCGYSYIQKHSSIDHDYLTDGFWAMSKEEELPNENMAVSFLIRMEDVTDSIMLQLSDTMSESKRSAKIKKISKKYQKAASEDGKYNVVVKSFFGGNEFYMFIYETYSDVRLVGAPPSSVGKFGGDTDNWMWPRHTGDFSIFRVYSAPDGAPAEYSEDNIPLKPKYHLPITLEGVEKNEFAMIWGYPGGTERYLTSYGIKYKLNNFYPPLIDVFGKELEIWKEDMDSDKEIKIKYSSKYFGISNAWKLFIGVERALKKLKVCDKKLAIEQEFEKWVNTDPEREAKYGSALKEIKEGYEQMAKDFKPMIYTAFASVNGAEILGFSRQYMQLHSLLEDKKTNADAIAETVEQLKEGLKEYFKDYNAPTDEKVMAAMLKIYNKNVPKEMHSEHFNKIVKKFKGDFKAYAEYLFNKSIFTSPEKINAFLDDPKFKTLDKDPAFKLMNDFLGSIMKIQGNLRNGRTLVKKGDRLFIAGLREMNPDKVFYPDANSSLRLTYGTVQDYFPADAVQYDFITTLAGVMEKEDPDDDEFIVDEKLKKLYAQKDFGPYGQDGKMITCFLTTNDITGGNSGSPVINGNGELIGLAFDGNWEAMSGDIAFETELQRCINVDIRYVLFIIDKLAGATNLIDELTIVEKKPKAQIKEVLIEISEIEDAEGVEVIEDVEVIQN